MSYGIGIVIALIAIFLRLAIKVLNEYERGVVFRLGRIIDHKGPGLIILIPVIDTMVRVSLRTVVMDVPPQDVITRDNVSVKVNAVVYFRVMDPTRATIEVEDYLFATSQLAQTTLRSVCGQSELDELLSERDKINIELQQIIDRQTDPWGVKVSAVEVKHIDLPTEMIRALARQAEAERERRAKIINAEGEFQAASRLLEAAEIISQEPTSLQLRFLQTLSQVAAENNSTVIFPLPIDMLKQFVRKDGKSESKEIEAAPAPVERELEAHDVVKLIDVEDTIAEDTSIIVKYLAKMALREDNFEQSERDFLKKTVADLGEQLEERVFDGLLRQATKETLQSILVNAKEKPEQFKEKLLFLGMLTAAADGHVGDNEKKLLAQSMSLLDISKQRYREIAKEASLALRARKAMENGSE